MPGIKAISDLEERVTALTARITAIEPEVAAQIREEEALEREHARQLGLEQLGEGSRAAVEGSREQWKRSKQRRFALAAALADLNQRHTQAEQDLRQAKGDAILESLTKAVADAQATVNEIVGSTLKGRGLVGKLKQILNMIYAGGREYEQVMGRVAGRLPNLSAPLRDASLEDPTGGSVRFSPAVAALSAIDELTMSWAMIRPVSMMGKRWQLIGEATPPE